MRSKLAFNIAYIVLSLHLAVKVHGQEPNPLGDQFQINTYTSGDQSNSAVVSDSNGNYIVVWESSGSSGSDSHITSIQGQRFNPGGSSLGGEFQINTFTLFRQRFAAASTATDGSFVVVWESESTNTGDSSGYSIKGQRYDADAMMAGSEFQVNTYTTDNQFFPFVASAPDGDFVVVWESQGSGGTDPTGYSIQGQRYASGGVEVGSQFQINTYTEGDQRFFLAESPMTMDTDGNFVVVWTSTGGGGDGSGDSVRGRRYDSNGAATGMDFQINAYTTGTQRLPSASMGSDGSFVVTWESDSSAGTDSDSRSIQARRFASIGTPIGDDFQVNTYTTGKQILPMAGTDSSGRVVIAWESGDNSGDGADGELGGIRAQFFDSGGTPLGGEFQVNSYTTGNQRYPSLAMGPGREFMVVWDGPEDNGGSNGIQGRRFISPEPGPALEPIPIGGEFQINTYTGGTQDHPIVEYDSSDNFTVVWTDENGQSDGFWSSIQGRRFDSDGSPLDVNEFQINSGTLFHQRFPDLAMTPSGEFAVVWQSNHPTGGTFDVKAQRYDSDANPSGGEFQVNTYTPDDQGYPFVSSDSTGNLAVVWESRGSSGSDDSGRSIQRRRYDTSGMALESDVQVNTETEGPQRLFVAGSAVSTDTDGDFVVVWTSSIYGGDVDGSGSSAHGQLYDADGEPSGPELQINTYTTGNQRVPAVSMTPAGQFVVVWESKGSADTDTDDGSIQAQRFASGGLPIGDQFQVNTYTTGNQTNPMAATDDSGRFIVGWQSGNGTTAGPDGDGASIQARYFEADGTAVGDEFQVNTYTTLDQSYPSVAMGPENDFVVVWNGRGDGSANSIWGQRYTTSLDPPGFSKSFVPDSIDFGEFSTLTFTIDNSANPVALDNLAFVDNLPAGMMIANPPGAVNGCGGVLIADAGTALISLSGGTVAAGSTCIIQVDVDTSCGMHVNTTEDLTSDVGNSGTASDTLTVICVTLELAKVESADPVPVSGNLTYTITVGNGGPSAATDLLLSEVLTLPADVTVDSITPSPGTSYDPPDSANGTWTIDMLDDGTEATLVVVLTIGASTSTGTDVICDTLTVTAVNEPNVGDTSVGECTSVVPDLIFIDGFESGDTAAWSQTVGGN